MNAETNQCSPASHWPRRLEAKRLRAPTGARVVVARVHGADGPMLTAREATAFASALGLRPSAERASGRQFRRPPPATRRARPPPLDEAAAHAPRAGWRSATRPTRRAASSPRMVVEHSRGVRRGARPRWRRHRARRRALRNAARGRGGQAAGGGGAPRQLEAPRTDVLVTNARAAGPAGVGGAWQRSASGGCGPRRSAAKARTSASTFSGRARGCASRSFFATKYFARARRPSEQPAAQWP